MPRHVNPTDPKRTATAPYNFVLLPERVFTVADGVEVAGEKIKPWERHDRFVPGTRSGWIDLEIETLTPLFIRGSVRERRGRWDDRDTRLRPEPWTTPEGRPAIPGSSLRGMVRTLVEILAFGKIQPVSEAKPFFRDISPSRISDEYRKQFIEDLGSIHQGVDITTGMDVQRPAPGYCSVVHAGFIDLKSQTIRECEVARVEASLIRKVLEHAPLQGRGPMAAPDWHIQHSIVHVQADPQPRDYFFCKKTAKEDRLRHQDLYLKFRKVHQLSRDERSGYAQATLVITGGVPHKHLEFVFLNPSSRAEPIAIPQSIWNRFHDQDQITQWQEKAFPRDKPRDGRRRRKGHLRDGEPVFFLLDEAARSEENPGGLVFLGRAGMFRLPYDLRPLDLVPDSLRNASLDLAEAIFGKVGRRDETIKGRVLFEDAVASENGPYAFEEVLVPRILSSPKPTTFQHYLTQDGTKDRRQLTTYLKGDRTAIRGHKLYWHRWDDAERIGLVKEKPDKHGDLLADLRQENPKDTQHTIIQPVTGVRFTARIRFDNLADLELGALLAALELPEGCAHQLGMGKSLGLGSVRLTARLCVVDRAARYRSWTATGAQSEETGARSREVFEGAMLEHARASGEAILTGPQGLRRIARLDALYRLLEWQGRPEVTKTKSMDLARFRDRPVLPMPHGVVGIAEPPWPGEPPQAGGSPEGAGGSRHQGGRPRARTAPAHTATPTARPLSKPPPARPKPIEKGQTPPGVLKRSGEDWIVRFEGDERDARIDNPEKIPAGCDDGTQAEFYIMLQSKRAGIKCRFVRLLGD